MAAVNGNDVGLYIDGDLIGCITNANFTASNEEIDVTCKEDAGVRKVIPGGTTAEITFEGFFDPTSTYNVQEIVNVHKNRTLVNFEMVYDNQDGDDIVLSGSGYINQLEWTSPLNAGSVFSGTIAVEDDWTYSTSSEPVVLNPAYPGLIAMWKLDGNGYDSSGFDFHGLVSSSTTFAAGKMTAQAAEFNGVTDSIIVADDAFTPDKSLSFGNGGTDSPFSVEAWVYPVSFTNLYQVIMTKGTLIGELEWSVWCEQTTGAVSMFLTNPANTNYLYATTTSGLPTNQWSFVTATYDGSKTFAGIKIYVNGVLQSLTNGSAGTYPGMTNGVGKLFIGNYATTLNFQGRINYAALYDKEVTLAEIQTRYNGGSGVVFNDVSGYQLFDFYIEPLKILARKGDYVFASDVTTGGTNLKFSSNGGSSWTDYSWGTQWSAGSVVYDKTVDFAYIFDNGTLLFSCGNLLYRSTNGLATAPSLVTPKLADGVTNYPVHTPANPIYPGNYFQAPYMDHKINYVNGTEILVWSNYCNVVQNNMGVAPTTVWYTIDNGATVKALYRFGQNTNYRDNGTPGGSASSGTLLGDASNTIVCRHAHGTFRNGTTLDWYTQTGDFGTGPSGEGNWIKHTYDPNTDTWSSSRVSGADSGSFWQSAVVLFKDGEVFWCPDAPSSSLSGIYRTSVANIGVSATRFADTYELAFGIQMNDAGNIVVLNSLPDIYNILTTRQGTRIRHLALTASPTAALNFLGGPPVNGYWIIPNGNLWFQPVNTIYFKLN